MTLISCRAALLCDEKPAGRSKCVTAARRVDARKFTNVTRMFSIINGVQRKNGSITAMEIQVYRRWWCVRIDESVRYLAFGSAGNRTLLCENVKTDVYAAYTNNNYTGAMRGFGSPQVNFANESMMDDLAEKVNDRLFGNFLRYSGNECYTVSQDSGHDLPQEMA